MSCSTYDLLSELVCLAQAKEMLMCTASEEEVLQWTQEEFDQVHRIVMYLDTQSDRIREQLKGIKYA